MTEAETITEIDTLAQSLHKAAHNHEIGYHICVALGSTVEALGRCKDQLRLGGPVTPLQMDTTLKLARAMAAAL